MCIKMYPVKYLLETLKLMISVSFLPWKLCCVLTHMADPASTLTTEQ